jgi:hypothetical protein
MSAAAVIPGRMQELQMVKAVTRQFSAHAKRTPKHAAPR